jgi:hypothetical protein
MIDRKNKLQIIAKSLIDLIPKNYLVVIYNIISTKLTSIEKIKYSETNVITSITKKKKIKLNIYNTKFFMIADNTPQNLSTYVYPEKSYFYEQSAFFILKNLFEIYKKHKITDSFLDIGSRYGYYCNFIAKKSPKTSVQSFEPIKKYYRMQKISKKINQIKNLNINCLGLSDRQEIISDEYKNEMGSI